MFGFRWLRQHLQIGLLSEAPQFSPIALQLYRLTIILIMAIGLFWSVFLLIDPSGLARFDTTMLLVAVLVIVLLLLRRQKIYMAGLVLVIGIWATLVLIGGLNGGVLSPAYAGLIVVTLSAGMLLGPRAAFICTAANIVVGLFYVYGIGLYWEFKPVTIDPVASWIAQSTFFMAAAGLFQVATESIRAALNDAKQQLHERQEIERQLRTSEQQLHDREHEYRLAITAADAVPYYRDYITDSYTFMGDAIATITGFPVAEITPQLLDSLEVGVYMRGAGVHLSVETAITLARSNQLKEWRSDMLIRARSGELRWLADSAVQIANDRGEIIGTFGILQDITERKNAEQALQESEERFRRLAEAGFEGIGIIEDDRLIDANPRLADMTGYTIENLLGRSVTDILTPESHDLILRNILTDTMTPIAHHASRSDGSLFPVETQARPLPRSGRSAYVIAMRDMSERVRFEEHLRQAQKLQAVGQLAGGLSHDFNNLLTIIISYTDVLIEQAQYEHLPAWLGQDLDQIRHASQRAATLIRQLLAFSRRQVLQVEEVNLNTVLTGIIPMLQRLIGPSFQLRTHLNEQLGWVCADAGQLEQVIINLVANGRDAMPNGGTLTIETKNLQLETTFMAGHAKLDPGQYVLLSITDTGTGMTVDTQAHIFEPFFTTKERGQGTGLGLATAHGIIKQLGGHIWFMSELYQGTTFTIGLPRTWPSHDAPQVQRPTLGVPTGHETILLIEDDRTVRHLVRTILQRYGYHVLECDNSEAEQFSATFTKRIHLLLTDVMMPGIDGVELARRLLIQRPDLRVLYMSGYTDSVLLDQSMVEGSMAFLQKPFAPVALAAKVRSVIDYR